MKNLIKKYTEFIKEGYYDPPEPEDSIIETFETELMKFEEKMKAEGMNVDPETFYEYLDVLKIEPDYEADLQNFLNKHHDTLYYAGFDSVNDENVTTDEYKRVVKQVGNIKNSRGIQDFKATQDAIRKALFSNIVEKHWDEYKEIYQKWIDYIHEHRGEIKGIDYGV